MNDNIMKNYSGMHGPRFINILVWLTDIYIVIVYIRGLATNFPPDYLYFIENTR